MAPRPESGPMVRFWSRVGALLGLLLVGVGLVFWSLEGTLLNVPSLAGIVLGLALLALGVAVNAVSVVQAVRSRRGALGLNEVVLVALAVALAGFVNYWAFDHSSRYDWTRGGHFTIPADTRDRLGRLKEPIDIVVYIAHKTFGRAGGKPDAYDYAAERKVVEKVRDLVEQYGKIGAQIRVQVLDVEEEGYDTKLEDLPAALRDEIAKAAENSIFFRSGERIRRLSFSDYYQLDKTASRARDNLVLRAQGQDAFSRQIFNLDEKKPNLVFAVAHEVLGLEPDIPIALKGVAEALDRWGMEGRTVILKEWPESGPREKPKAAVMSYKENQHGKLQKKVKFCEDQLEAWKEQSKELHDLVKKFAETSLEDLEKDFKDQLQGQPMTERIRKNTLGLYRFRAALADEQLQVYRETKADAERELATFDKAEIEQMQKFTDLDQKLRHVLQDCDLLVVPRSTWQEINIGNGIPNWVYELDQGQVDAFRRYLRKGRPLLAALGPFTDAWNEDFDPRKRDPRMMGMQGPPPPPPRHFEKLLAEYGVELDSKLILFDSEVATFGEPFSSAVVPRLQLQNPKRRADDPTPLNPVAQSLVALENGRDLPLETKARHPRPVRYKPERHDRNADPYFLWTDEKSWGETKPFREYMGPRDYVPKFDPKPKLATDAESSREPEDERGPLPIAVAVERTADPGGGEDGEKTTRLAVVGKAALFTGTQLAPENEKLFINLVNWLLGRDYLLGLNTTEWSHPRMAITAEAKVRWLWLLRLGMPVLCAFVGAVVLMYREVH